MTLRPKLWTTLTLAAITAAATIAARAHAAGAAQASGAALDSATSATSADTANSGPDPHSSSSSAPQVAPGAEAQTESVPVAPPISTPEEVRARLATRFEGALLDTTNGQDFVMTQGYMKLLSSVAQFSAEDATARATKHLDWHAAMRSPDEWRGEWVTFRGIVAQLAAEKLVSPVDGREHVWRAIVVNDTEDMQPKKLPEGGVFVDLLDRPDAEFDVRRDPVDVIGVFYRTLAYENKQGQTVQAAYLIGRVLKHVDREAAKRSTMPWWGVAIIGGGCLVGAMHLFNILRSRTRRRRDEELAGADFHQMFQARMKGVAPKSRQGSPH
ncbi:MAG: hypothetical protein L6Q99_21415 [Planctomycetes bacterium]|nr:hypothetical protein [Planctomycetota bacterium]